MVPNLLSRTGARTYVDRYGKGQNGGAPRELPTTVSLSSISRPLNSRHQDSAGYLGTRGPDDRVKIRRRLLSRLSDAVWSGLQPHAQTPGRVYRIGILAQVTGAANQFGAL